MGLKAEWQQGGIPQGSSSRPFLATKVRITKVEDMTLMQNSKEPAQLVLKVTYLDIAKNWEDSVRMYIHLEMGKDNQTIVGNGRTGFILDRLVNMVGECDHELETLQSVRDFLPTLVGKEMYVIKYRQRAADKRVYWRTDSVVALPTEEGKEQLLTHFDQQVRLKKVKGLVTREEADAEKAGQAAPAPPPESGDEPPF